MGQPDVCLKLRAKVTKPLNPRVGRLYFGRGLAGVVAVVVVVIVVVVIVVGCLYSPSLLLKDPPYLLKVFLLPAFFAGFIAISLSTIFSARLLPSGEIG